MSILRTIATVALAWIYGVVVLIGVANGIRIGQLVDPGLGWLHAITFGVAASFLFIPGIREILEDKS